MSSQIYIAPDTIATVDDDDAEWLKRCVWNMSGTGEAVGHSLIGGRLVSLELGPAIMNALPGETVIQVNPDNRFDYRKHNLQVVAPRRNFLRQLLIPRAVSGLRGVSWHLLRRRYRVQIRHRGCHFNLGFYEDPVEAGMVFDAAAQHLVGRQAYRNFPHRRTPPDMMSDVVHRLARTTR